MYYIFCKKCGRLAFGNPYLEERCDICGNIMIQVPSKYIQENEVLTDKESEDRAIKLREELVKTSPEFDQYLFDHRDEILSKKSAAYNAKMAHGKAVLEGRNKGNSYGVSCPYCHATNVKKISMTSRVVSTGLFGLSSKKLGKQWHCNKCGSDF